MTEILAVIPARGGSKGIPGKNLLSLAGKPLISYSIEAALASRSIKRVVVSTDDARIADVSRKFGVEVIVRPDSISGDEATSESALIHALEDLQSREKYDPDLLVFIQCTSPLTTGEVIDGTIKILRDKEADCSFTAAPFHGFLWRVNEHGKVTAVNHNMETRARRQAIESDLLETGAVYVMKVGGFLKHRHRFFGKVVVHRVPRESAVEIDEPLDVPVAQVLLGEDLRRRQIEMLPDTISCIVFDFDGVFTDNRVVVFQDGREAVLCHRGDGLGLSGLKETGLPLLVLSSEENPVVKARCDKMGIPCITGLKDKSKALIEWLNRENIPVSEAIFVGNDLNDVECMQSGVFGIAVADAHPDIKPFARVCLKASGGRGAVRELCDLVMGKMEGTYNAKDD